MVISCRSFAASSARFPFSNCSIDSRRCLIIVVMTRLISASSRSFFISVSLFITAALIMRITSIRNWSRAFMANFKSSVRRSWRDIGVSRVRGLTRGENTPSFDVSQCPAYVGNAAVCLAWFSYQTGRMIQPRSDCGLKQGGRTRGRIGNGESRRNGPDGEYSDDGGLHGGLFNCHHTDASYARGPFFLSVVADSYRRPAHGDSVSAWGDS